jgi:hypothetical protein
MRVAIYIHAAHILFKRLALPPTFIAIRTGGDFIFGRVNNACKLVLKLYW